MAIITENLLKELKSISNIEEFFKKYENDFICETAPGYLTQLLEIKGLSLSDVAKNSGAGEYVYKIFRGDRTASRDVLISIAFGMKLTLEETQLLLRIGKFAILDSRNKRDSVIIFAITHNLDIFETDDLLEEQKLVTLH